MYEKSKWMAGLEHGVNVEVERGKKLDLAQFWIIKFSQKTDCQILKKDHDDKILEETTGKID